MNSAEPASNLLTTMARPSGVDGAHVASVGGGSGMGWLVPASFAAQRRWHQVALAGRADLIAAATTTLAFG